MMREKFDGDETKLREAMESKVKESGNLMNEDGVEGYYSIEEGSTSDTSADETEEQKKRHAFRPQEEEIIDNDIEDAADDQQIFSVSNERIQKKEATNEKGQQEKEVGRILNTGEESLEQDFNYSRTDFEAFSAKMENQALRIKKATTKGQDEEESAYRQTYLDDGIKIPNLFRVY
jgi:hypothetical protein